MQKLDKQFHIHCVEGDVGRYCLLPGDPGRCESIAKLFDNPVHVAQNREYNISTKRGISSWKQDTKHKVFASVALATLKLCIYSLA